MRLCDIRRDAVLPIEEIVLGKTIMLKEFEVHLLSITNEEHRNVLWTLFKLPPRSEGVKSPEPQGNQHTNKEDMLKHCYGYNSACNFAFIIELSCKQQKMTFNSSNTIGFDQFEPRGYMLLQHFIEKGLLPIAWAELDLEQIFIISFEQNEQEDFPRLERGGDYELTLKLNQEIIQVPINQRLTVKMGENRENQEYYFYDILEHRKRRFYINQVEVYDIWAEVAKRETAYPKTMTLEQIDKLNRQNVENMERMCPKGHKLALLEYETEDNIQLNFYSREYHDAEPIYSNSACISVFSSDREYGRNGFKSRMCMIKPIEPDFIGEIDIELFSWLNIIPIQTITTSINEATNSKEDLL